MTQPGERLGAAAECGFVARSEGEGGAERGKSALGIVLREQRLADPDVRSRSVARQVARFPVACERRFEIARSEGRVAASERVPVLFEHARTHVWTTPSAGAERLHEECFLGVQPVL